MPVLLSSIEGNKQKLDGGSMFGNAPRVMWEKWMTVDSIGRIDLACRSLLIEINDQKILCEVGVGAYFEPKLADRYGIQNPEKHLLLEGLSHLDISHEDIDYVVLSHLHFDHAGGLFPSYQERSRGQFKLLFPNARYLVGKRAFERAVHPHKRDRVSFIPELPGLLQGSGRLVLLEGDKLSSNEDWAKKLNEYISFFYSDGHTPGQMHTVVKGEKQSIVFCGDLIPGTPWVHIPITMGYDRFAELVIDEKTELLEKVVGDGWLLFYTHDPLVSASKCVEDDRHRCKAVDEIGELNRYSL
ncbi:MAG: MBL fold metallo-hydrolase [Bdellovibrionota bacterium]